MQNEEKMTTFAKPDSRDRCTTGRPNALDWLVSRELLAVIAWDDPTHGRPGHDPRSDYVEMFWLPVIGPSATLAARRLAGWLDQQPAGFESDIAALSVSLGLGVGKGRNAPINRTLARLVDFGLVRLAAHTYGLARRFPTLNPKFVARLPEHLIAAHVEAGYTSPAGRR